jgi:hypothetical protein
MYKIIGADGREYGPATAGQLRQWMAEGRANAQTPTLAPGAPEWKPLGALPEFAGHFAPPIPPAIGPLKPGTSTAGQLPKTNSFATAGLVFGILSLTSFCCCCGCPFNILGLVFSLIGLSQINRHPELYEGRESGFGIRAGFAQFRTPPGERRMAFQVFLNLNHAR